MIGTLWSLMHCVVWRGLCLFNVVVRCKAPCSPASCLNLLSPRGDTFSSRWLEYFAMCFVPATFAMEISYLFSAKVVILRTPAQKHEHAPLLFKISVKCSATARLCILELSLCTKFFELRKFAHLYAPRNVTTVSFARASCLFTVGHPPL